MGKPSLGFLNPLLYSRGAAALNDITQGNNPGCGTLGFNVSLLVCHEWTAKYVSLKATKGWDPGKFFLGHAQASLLISLSYRSWNSEFPKTEGTGGKCVKFC